MQGNFSTISVDIICLADIHYLECSLHLASFSMTAKYSSPIWSIYGIYYIYTLRIQVNHEINSRLGEVRPLFFVGIYFINNFKGLSFLMVGLTSRVKKTSGFISSWHERRTNKNWIWILLQLLVVGGWTTHLKNMLVKMGSSSPRFGVNMKNIWVATT